MAFRTFQRRVVVSFLALITLVQVGALIAVDSAIARSARAHVKAELAEAATTVKRLIDARSERLVHAARILSSDFPFKQVVALDDRDTLLSAMDNHRTRIGAELMTLVSLDGSRTVATLHRDTRTRETPTPPAVSKMIDAARGSGEVSDFFLFNGRPYQVVVVPLLAPAPIAWIGMGFPLDTSLAEELRKTTSAHVSFVHAATPGLWRSITSTLPAATQPVVLETLARRGPSGDAERSFTLPGTDLETLMVPLRSATDLRTGLVLHRSLAEAMAPYRHLRVALLALSAAAAVISIVGGIWIARGVSRPVRQLAEAARNIETGNYSGRVPATRPDELGALADTFNRMTGAVAEREERLRESEQRFRAMTESAVDAVVTADARGDIVSWNRGAQAIFGFTADEVLGTPLVLLFPDRYVGRDPASTPHGLTKDEREIPIEVSVATWETRQGAFRTAIIRDVSERKELEEQVRQAQKMESVGRLAGGVAHDFNNLLMVIGGYVQLLSLQLGREHAAQEKLGMIQQAAGHAAELTRQLLAFSRKQVLEPKILDLNVVVAEVAPMMRRLIGEHIELVHAPTPGLGRVEADPGQITQIILNLAVNARDAMPSGGKLTLQTANVELDETHAHRHGDTRPGPYAMLAVTDTGTGMDEETRSHIFEPFFTTKEAGRGTGLGLATVYGIVKQSNGTIHVDSEPGRGTTFMIYLPRVDATPDTTTSEGISEEVGGTETVLLVEDNEMVRAFACEVLRGRGYTVLEAHHGNDALDITQRYHGAIDLLLTDLVMPEMGGRELATRLTPTRPRMKVLYMSGYPADTGLDPTALDEHESYITKPVSADGLLRKVRGVLDAV